LVVTDYEYNHRLAIMLNGADDYFDVLTINLSDLEFTDINQGFISADIDSAFPEIISTLKELGIIEKSYGYRQYNYGKYELVDFNLEKLKEYDLNGVNNFLQNIDLNRASILYGFDFFKERQI